jgi:hypothetical protein
MALKGETRRSRFAIAMAVVALSVLVVAGVLISVGYVAYTTKGSQTTTGGSTPPSTTTAASPTGDPLLDVPGLPALYHEDCATPLPSNTSTTCATSTSTVGVPQTFNMSTGVVDSDGHLTGVLHEHLFAFELNQSATIQFAYRGAEPNTQPAYLQVYFDGGAVNFTDLRGAVESGSARLVAESPAASLVGLVSVDRYSGQIAASPGVYIFDFQTQSLGTGLAYFLVRDATALQKGIQVSIGTPSVSSGAEGAAACGGGPGETGFGEEEFPVTVTSDTTSDVTLTSPNVPYGVWVQFVPSQLEDVGPQGANATMLLAGDSNPNGGDSLNYSLFIDASSSSGGFTGETALPLDAAYGQMQVLQSAGPFGELPTANPRVVFFQSAPLDEGQNQTNYAVIGDVYDPLPGTTQGSSLAVTITGVGLMQNATETPLPGWLQVTPVNSSFVMLTDQPYYLQVCVDISALAPQGSFTVVLNERVNGQPFSGEFVVQVQGY